MPEVWHLSSHRRDLMGCLTDCTSPRREEGFVEVRLPARSPARSNWQGTRLLRQLGFRVYVLDDEKQIGGMIDEIRAT